MEITVTGRRTEVPERFRRHIEEKMSKVAQLDSRVSRCEVVVSHEPNPRQAKAAERVEITCRARRKVFRAEASADEPYAALDLAMGRLLERMRRRNDKRRVHRGRQRPLSVAEATAGLPTDEILPQSNGTTETVRSDAAKVGGDEDCPIELREKTHQTHPMPVDEALSQMELVGHDFYLYHDTETDKAAVVYRRQGWSYGVIHLDVEHSSSPTSAEESA